MELAINPIPKKLVVNITQFKLVVKTNFDNKVFSKEILVNEFRQGNFGFNRKSNKIPISVKFTFNIIPLSNWDCISNYSQYCLHYFSITLTYITLTTFSLTSNPTSFDVVEEFGVVAKWKTTNLNRIEIGTSPSISFQTIGAFYSSLSVVSKKVKSIMSPKNVLLLKNKGLN